MVPGLAVLLGSGAVIALGCAGAPPAEKASPAASASATAKAAVVAVPTATAVATVEPTAQPAPEPPSKWAKCEAAPVGMVCIPGGPAVMGSDEHEAREKPRHAIEVSTFYLDRYEVTNERYEACEKAGACPARILPDKTFLAVDQPAVPVTWFAARAYCQWAGKRLPTEAEWEKAARGGDDRTYPWGDEPSTCDRAQTEGCAPNTTKPVGSFAAGPYGVFDMAGNGYEWTADYASACYDGCREACGAACKGEDPWGPCGGAPVCKGHKEHVLKGGSWRWAVHEARGAWRRFEEPGTGAHRLSARCASSGPDLATWPPLALSDPPALPADPEPLTAEMAAAFHDVVEDTDILKIPVCDKPGGSTTACRDPISYLTTNEPDQHLWAPYVRHVGGGYVGIGADQNYSLIAQARSRFAWLFDYDPQVVRLHLLLRAVILASPTAKDLVEAFAVANAAKTRAAIAEHTPPEEKEAVLRVLLNARDLLHADYSKRMKTPEGARRTYDWLSNPESYRYIRLLYQQGRIQPLKGNLLTDKILPSIAKNARSLGIQVAVLYTSNADDQWQLTPQFRANIVGLPFEERTVWLRTVYPRDKQRTKVLPWDYVIHAGLDAQRKLRHDGWDRVFYFNRDAHKIGPDNLLAVALPARTEREKSPGAEGGAAASAAK
ncbi:MAG: SUMF1/EgtB/PvdO family nonheme iron enzyme [Polyangiaceae bacterium]